MISCLRLLCCVVPIIEGVLRVFVFIVFAFPACSLCGLFCVLGHAGGWRQVHVFPVLAADVILLYECPRGQRGLAVLGVP